MNPEGWRLWDEMRSVVADTALLGSSVDNCPIHVGTEVPASLCPRCRHLLQRRDLLMRADAYRQANKGGKR